MDIYIIRGGSGAGKSTWTKTNHPSAAVVSADHFFIVGGEYKFDPARLGEAHAQCLQTFIALCQSKFAGHTEIIVDNTNSTISEFAPYAQVGLAYGHNVQILTFLYDPVVAHGRNIHGAPLKVCIDMHSRMTEHTKLIPPWWKHDYVLSK